MQLTSPAFLFLFLPLSLLYLPLCPPKWRKGVLSILSILWFVLANWQHPLSLIQIGFVVLLITAISLMPGDVMPLFRLVLGVGVPLAVFFTARALAELAPTQYAYPFGLGFVTLGSISLSIDRYRGDAPESEGPLATLGYLLFFPTLTVGPILRYKQYLYVTEHICPSFASFCEGALRYVIGFLKRVAVATVLFACLHPLLYAEDRVLSLPLLLFMLLLAFFFLYYAITGTTDMARGLLQIYGLKPPRGQGYLFSSTNPHRMLSHLLLSFDRFIEDYVGAPLRRLFPGKRGRMLSALAFFLCTLLFYRTRLSLLVVGVPILVTALIATRHGRWKRTVQNRALRLLLSVLSACLLSVLALAMMLDQPLRVISMFVTALTQTGHPLIYQTLASLSYGRYLLWVLPVAIFALPLSRAMPRLLRRLPTHLQEPARAIGTLICLVTFFLVLVFLYPQFPAYAAMTYRYFLS